MTLFDGWNSACQRAGGGGPKRRLEMRAVLPIVGCGGEAFVVEFMGKEAMRMDAKAAGELIAARRKALGMNQAELAGRLHVTDKAVSKWETGRGMPGIDCLEPLAEVLGLSVSELLSGRVLTAEELPKAAGGQIVEVMQAGKHGARRGVLLTAALVLLLAVILPWAGRSWMHWHKSADGGSQAELERAAAEYLGRPRHVPLEFDTASLRIVETERRGDYLAALCADGGGNWAMCVYDRDEVFPERWRASGGKPDFSSGKLTSWNLGYDGDAIIVFCGGNLPREAEYYRFQNSGITYTCPIEDGRVLDLFLLPDTPCISSDKETLLDENLEPLGPDAIQ